MLAGRWLLAVVLIFYCGVVGADECPEIRLRREWRTLTHEEHLAYFQAIKMVKTKGLLDEMLELHKDNNAYAHEGSGFLPWHRLFILKMEDNIRSLGGEYTCYALPYWDWSADTLDVFDTPLWSDDDGMGVVRSGCIRTGPFAGLVRNDNYTCVERQVPIFNPAFTPFIGLQRLIQNYPFYLDFEPRFEFYPHSIVHVGVSGDLKNLTIAPGDPIFWLHHNFIDKVWAMWEDCWDYDQIPESDLAQAQYWASSDSFPVNAAIDYPMPGWGAFTPREVYNWTKFNYMWETWEWEMEQMAIFGSSSACKYDLFQFQASSDTPHAPDNSSADTTDISPNAPAGDISDRSFTRVASVSHKLARLHRHTRLTPSSSASSSAALSSSSSSPSPSSSSSSSPSLLSHQQKEMIVTLKNVFQGELARSGDNLKALDAAMAAICDLRPLPDVPQYYLDLNGLTACANTTYCTSPCKLL